ncbi:MAG: starch-binding protein, partial [Ruminococcus sp.]|nr:starch-binding protein [Ruminococcus sp.]
MKRLLSVLLAVCMLFSMFAIVPVTASAETTDNITVYFTDALSWGDVHVYYWPNGGEWPGTAMDKDIVNDYGQQVYKAVIPASAEGIVFNGNGNQTVDIKDGIEDGAAWYTIEEKEGNNYKVEKVEIVTPEPEPTTPETTATETTATEETTAPETGKSIHAYFTGVEAPGSAWMAWTWNDGEEGEWRPIEKFAYVSVKDNVLFANFNEVNLNASWDDVLAQTVDTKVKDGDSISVLNEKDNEGKYLIKWASDETTAPETTAPETTAPVVGEEVTLYFTNNKGWSDIKAHMWKEGGESTEWPGVAATYVKDNDYGEAIYSVTINTATYDHVIFNGNGGQTANIAVADAVAGGCGVYCLDTQDGDGHYNVGFYEYSAEPETTAPTTAPETTAPTTAPDALTDGY